MLRFSRFIVVVTDEAGLFLVCLVHHVWSKWRPMGDLLQDLRYGSRMLRASPGFTGTALLSLALGIGANAAVFSLINAALLRMLPVQNPEELVLLSHTSRTERSSFFSRPLFEGLRDGNQVFSGMLAFFPVRFQVSIDSPETESDGEPLYGELVSGSYFSVLGINAAIGRTITADDNKVSGGQPVVDISYDFWKSRFARDPAAVGKTVNLNGLPFTVIGVTPPGFVGLYTGMLADFWTPLAMQAQVMPGPVSLKPPGLPVWVMGRLKPEITVQQARVGLNVTFQQLLTQAAASSSATPLIEQPDDQRIELGPTGKGLSNVSRDFFRPLLILMAGVGLVLLIACANVANLLLARAAARQKEIAVRLAVGAGRWRLIRQLLTESVLLATGGGALGLLFAQWGKSVLGTFLAGEMTPIAFRADLDTRVLGFTWAVSLLTGILFGLAPAFRAVRVDLSPALKENARNLSAQGLTGRRLRFGFGRLLVVSQIAVSVLLLIAAGLFVRTLQKLENVDLGFNRDSILIAGIGADANFQRPAHWANFYREIAERAKTIPGVRLASLYQRGLFSGWNSQDVVSVEGYTPRAQEDMQCYVMLVGPQFFKTVGIPLVAGRDLDEHDTERAPNVAVISESVARRYFQNTSPIGRQLAFKDSESIGQFEIVGIVKDSKYNSPREQNPRIVYAPLLQARSPGFKVNLVLRTAGNPSRIAAAFRGELRAVDKHLHTRLLTLNVLMDRFLLQERFIARFSILFATLALLLACVGLYGVLSYAFSRRTNEIGIRMALGAQRRDVVWLVLREAIALVATGVGIGTVVAVAAARLISSMLFQLSPADPITIVTAALLITSVAALAGYIPARRASRSDPLVALRYE